MDDRSGGASALLGMDGFVVLSTTETDDELWLLVETTAQVVGCATCGVRAVGHGRSEVHVRDLPIGGRPVRLVWRKRRWLCSDADCPTKSFTEQSELIEGCLTRRSARSGDLPTGRRRRTKRRLGGPILRGGMARGVGCGLSSRPTARR